MSIGKNYKEAFQKSVRSLEIGRHGLGFAKDFNSQSLPELLAMLAEPSSERQFIMYEALRKGASVQELYEKTRLKHWFIQQMKELVELEEKLLSYKGEALPDALLMQAKKDGFADKYLSKLLGIPEEQFRRRRLELGVEEAWEPVPVSGVKNAAYYFSTYNASDKVATSSRRKIMVLGGGPNRIGQGIEFDYCCVHAAFAAREAGYETIMVNCNPETVSTDYDTSDKLYFEPLTVEDVLAIYQKEKPEGVIVQFGGQTPLNIAAELAKAGVKILGTSPASIELAEDRDLFRKRMAALDIPMPESAMAANLEQALAAASRIGYPLMLRPSFVLGGRGMEVIHDEQMLRQYVAAAVGATPERPILIDKFLENALEVEADAIADGTEVFIPAIMEHIEQAGIHSGDSACVIPPISIPPQHLETIARYTRMIAQELEVVGLMNMQYAIAKDTVYVLEANPRASRTVPLVSKVCNIAMARIATQVMLGRKLADLKLPRASNGGSQTPKYAFGAPAHFGVKEAVFPFNMFPEVDPILGPEMRSTGEVLGMADSFGLAFYKSQEGAGASLPIEGTVLISVSQKDRGTPNAEQRAPSGEQRVWGSRPYLLEVARRFQAMGFKIRATEGTQRFLSENGIKAEFIRKQHQGRPNIVDGIKNGEIQLVINTPVGRLGQEDDSYIRKAAVKYRVPYVTTLTAALAAAEGIAARRRGRGQVRSLQSYHEGVKSPSSATGGSATQ
jgi:carbamoyl-phosphate synthase large subunit